MKFRQYIFQLRKKLFKARKPALNGIDRKLEKYIDFHDGFFIEAGANDGYSQSNTYFLENDKNWKGLLIEAIPSLYEECKRIRPGSVVLNRGLVSSDYIGETVRVHFAGLMSLVDGAMKSEGQQNSHIDAGIKIQHLCDTYSVDVAACTLESILDSLGSIPNIDFFSLDVEGYELQVLRGLNLKRYRPTYILVEARYYEEVDAILVENNYAQVEQLSHHDFLYVDNSDSLKRDN